MVENARNFNDAIILYEEHRNRIKAEHEHSDLDKIDRGLEHQNKNPVKVLTSGKEWRIETPFEASGKVRYEERVQWWKDCDAKKLCVFGHYSFFKGDSNSSGKGMHDHWHRFALIPNHWKFH